MSQAYQHHHRDSSSGLDPRPTVVGLHFRIGRKIGEGSFGVIHEGINVLDNRAVAIKFEPKRTEAPQLRDEYKSYKLLAGTTGIPAVYYYGQEGAYNCLVIDLLGHSLEDLFDFCGRRFTLKTVCMLAKQMVSRLRAVHDKHLIYRDIKPDNFLMGRRDKSNIVFLVDFGMAKHYRDPKTRQHIPYKERKSLSGTARYMSINTHMGREQSRRDDLESLGHVFMYFLRGHLPWQGLKAATNKQKYEKIGQTKQAVPIKDLCDGFPEEFATYLYYARGLQFEEEPNYEYLLSLFDAVLARFSYVEDQMYDWMILPRKESLVDQGSIKSFPANYQHSPGGLEGHKRQPMPSSMSHLPYGNQVLRKPSFIPLNASVRPLYDVPLTSLHDAPPDGSGIYPRLSTNPPTPQRPYATAQYTPKSSAYAFNASLGAVPNAGPSGSGYPPGSIAFQQQQQMAQMAALHSAAVTGYGLGPAGYPLYVDPSNPAAAFGAPATGPPPVGMAAVVEAEPVPVPLTHPELSTSVSPPVARRVPLSKQKKKKSLWQRLCPCCYTATLDD